MQQTMLQVEWRRKNFKINKRIFRETTKIQGKWRSTNRKNVYKNCIVINSPVTKRKLGHWNWIYFEIEFYVFFPTFLFKIIFLMFYKYRLKKNTLNFFKDRKEKTLSLHCNTKQKKNREEILKINKILVEINKSFSIKILKQNLLQNL